MKPRQVLDMAGQGRRWVESIVLSFIGWLAKLAAALAWALIVFIIAGILAWLASRQFAWPLPAWLTIRVQPSELVGMGVFLFCAAFALKARAG